MEYHSFLLYYISVATNYNNKKVSVSLWSIIHSYELSIVMKRIIQLVSVSLWSIIHSY